MFVSPVNVQDGQMDGQTNA